MPRGVETAVRVPGLKNSPRQGIPGVQQVFAWNGSYCFDTVRASGAAKEDGNVVFAPAALEGICRIAPRERIFEESVKITNFTLF
jgi:hypothetical protein